jgi:hypothetical protein
MMRDMKFYKLYHSRKIKAHSSALKRQTCFYFSGIVLILIIFFTTCYAVDLPLPVDSAELVVQNRILAKVNDKKISVLDLVKKMDVFLSRFYPDVLNSSTGRYQFYATNWRDILEQMVDQELILADGNTKELKATDAEVRELMMQRFGPNIMSSLDQLGMTYEEAREMISTEIVVQKMTWYRVNNKAIQKIQPQDIKIAYQEYCKKNPPLEKWKYQVFSLKADTPEKSQELSERAYQLLQEPGSSFASVAEQLIAENPHVSISVSQDYDVDSKGVSAPHREVLSTLTPTKTSAPVAQVSRVDQTTVYRIFHLKEYAFKATPTFESVCEKLKDTLVDQSIARETKLYINKLRDHYGFDSEHLQQMIPSDFEPFSLR